MICISGYQSKKPLPQISKTLLCSRSNPQFRLPDHWSGKQTAVVKPQKESPLQDGTLQSSDPETLHLY